MNNELFRAGGALTDLHSQVYIQRESDFKALQHLTVMDYVLLIEPRQQGKTSLINFLIRHPALKSFLFSYIDITSIDRASEHGWYQSLCSRIVRLCQRRFPNLRWPSLSTNNVSWRDFLFDLAVNANALDFRIIIALDEIGAVTFSGATEFFSVLRDVYNSRQVEPEFRNLSFILSGAFHPRDLITDDKISPFNIAQRIRIPDFSIQQIQQLLNLSEWQNRDKEYMAERIYHWTSGQPYLTQLICIYLKENVGDTNVDDCIERLRREDENHLPPILQRLNTDVKLAGYLDRILSNQRIKFYPQQDRRQGQLELLGLLRADNEGYCEIRNRIYEESLSNNNTSTNSSDNKSNLVVGQQHKLDASFNRKILNTGKAWGILVGVNNYDDLYIGSLKAAVQDVTALYSILHKQYEAIQLLTDETIECLPTRANILSILSSISQIVGEEDLLLFYFSGHGIAQNGDSYLLPRDTKISAVPFTAIAMSEVRKLFGASPARAKIIIIDACHSGASTGRATSVMTEEFIRHVFEEAEGFAILASCKQGQKSWEWREKGQGVFTYYLLEGLRGEADFDKKGFVTVSDISRYITDRVKYWSAINNAPQTPTLQYTVVGDIVLLYVA